MKANRFLLLLVVAHAPLAVAAESQAGWEVIATGAISVKSRARAGTPIKELWAEGEIPAPVQDIQAALMDPASFPRFMPYVKESRLIGAPEPDGSRIVYTRLDLPLVDPRDYVLKVTLEESVAPDGTGAFRNKWVALNDRLPPRTNVVRLKVNDGSWHVTPRGPNKSWAVYKFAVDPGGWIPSFAADLGNKTGVTDTFSAVSKEAQRRAALRARAPKPPTP